MLKIQTKKSGAELTSIQYNDKEMLFQGAQVLDSNGGPNNVGVTVGFYLYRYAFSYFRMGIASATAWVLAAVIMIITIFNFIGSRKWVSYD